MKLHCPDCGAAVAAQDVNIDKLLAKCAGCGNVFGFGQLAEAERAQTQRRSGPPVEPLARPRRMEVHEGAGTWSATWRWFKPGLLVLVLFCIFWDGILGFWYSMAFMRSSPLLVKLFPVLHVAVGVILTYATLCGFINRSTVEMSRTQLSIRHGPMPWLGNRVLSPTQIDQVYEERRGSSNTRTGNTTYNYAVFARLTDGGKLALLTNLQDENEARFLAQQIADHLRMA